MKARGLPALGVERPVLVCVLNLLIVIAGIAAALGVSVRELPNVDSPLVMVRASMPGASPETMDAEVTRLLEGAVARVPGVISIESASEEDSARVKANFRVGSDLATAATDVREAVNQVTRELPEAVEQVTVTKADSDAEPIIKLAVWGRGIDAATLALRIDKDIAPELLSIPGVADLQIEGQQTQTLTVRLDPLRMASYRVGIEEVLAVVQGARFDVPAGSLPSKDQTLIVRAYATVVDPVAFEKLKLRDDLTLGDIATVYFAPGEENSYSVLNGRRVVGLGIIRQAGANTIAISDETAKRMAQINERARDFELALVSDEAVYIRGALADVLRTLAIAIVIVLLVIALFLRQWRAVLVPAVTMPVALVGTLAAVYALGFSINLLTLLALVLATGLIVDDAIVVLENIQRRRGDGEGALAAAVRGADQVFFAVIATTATLVAVFLPIAFLPGETGRLFREFGLTLASAVVISSFVAVTVCPMLASRLPAPRTDHHGRYHPARLAAALGHGLGALYFRSLDALLRQPWAAVLIALAIVYGGLQGFAALKQELLPSEDRGAVRVLLTGPDGASLSYAGRQALAVDEALAPHVASGLVRDVYTIVGSWDPHRSFTTATLAPWGERRTSQQALAAELNEALDEVTGSRVRIIQSSTLNQRGPAGLEFAVLGSDYDALAKAAFELGDALVQAVPEITDVNVKYDTSQPQLSFRIDRLRAAELGVSLPSIAATLQSLVDEYEAADLQIDDQTVPIVIRSSRERINDPGDLLNVFVTNDAGELVPLATLITIEERGVAAQLDRYAQSRAVEVDVGTAPGAPIAELTDAIRRIAREQLPTGTNISFLGEAADLASAERSRLLTFSLALLVVFLVLAAQFESLLSALIVMLTVPLGLAAAALALLAAGQSLNLYSQIGLIMLVGILTKNAILLVEFMDQCREAGMAVPEAVREGVRVRVRPLLMTALSTVLGAVPLILSGGPGAEARNAIGWVVFGGAGLATIFTLYFAPVAYALLAPFTQHRGHAGQRLAQELAAGDTMTPARSADS